MRIGPGLLGARRSRRRHRRDHRRRRRALARARPSSNPPPHHLRWHGTPRDRRCSLGRLAAPRPFRGHRYERRRRRRPEGMRQISRDPTLRPRAQQLCVHRRATPRRVASRAPLEPQPGSVCEHPAPDCARGSRPGSGATRPRRRRARSRHRQPRARRPAPRSSSVVGTGAGSSTICVRHHSPSPSRSGSCTTSPAACRSSSQRCTLRRCARTNRARSARTARHRAPADHRRQPRHQLRDRRRVARRTLRVTEPEQVALDRVRARLQPIITRRLAPARTTSAAEQRAHDEPPRLRRQRLDRRPIPTTRRPSSTRNCRSVVQRHRQRPKTPRQQQAALRPRADARGTAETVPDRRDTRALNARRIDPSTRGWRSVRNAATVRSTCICGRSPRSVALSGRKAADEDRAPTRSFSFCGDWRGGPRQAGSQAVDAARRKAAANSGSSLAGSLSSSPEAVSVWDCAPRTPPESGVNPSQTAPPETTKPLQTQGLS